MKKLSKRAKVLLRIIANECEVDWDTGKISRFFVPHSGSYYIDEDTTYISGAGDANCLRGLENAGLIERPKTSLPQDYIYVITKKGHEVVQEIT
jgi:hypothetical protein